MKFINSIKVFRRYQYLLSQLVARDFKVKYKRSVLGVLWSVLNPLFTMIILFVVFSAVLGMGNTTGTLKQQVGDYPVFLLSGIVLWNYLAEATNLCLGSVVANFPLLTKVYMPKYIFPLSKVFSTALNLLFSLVALYFILIIRVIQGVVPLYWTNLLLPFDLLFLIVFASGLGLLLATLTVYFRDMYHIYGVVLTAWMYLTPVMYPLSLITGSHMRFGPISAHTLGQLLKINPMYQYLNFARTILLFGRVPTLGQWAGCIVCSVVMLVIGTLVFRSKQDKFIYHI